MPRKVPIRIATVFGEEPDQIELPASNPAIARLGTAIVDVRPIDGIGFELYSEMEADKTRAQLLWQITARCLPALTEDEVKTFTPSECAAVLAVAVGKVKEVQALAEEIAGNAAAPTTAEPELQKSPTLSDSSVSASLETSGGGPPR